MIDRVRTDLQREADAADSSLYRLASRLDGMSALYGKPDLKKAADIVASARSAVRSHMHADDREMTHGPNEVKS